MTSYRRWFSILAAAFRRELSDIVIAQGLESADCFIDVPWLRPRGKIVNS
jgi:hypothetical protein